MLRQKHVVACCSVFILSTLLSARVARAQSLAPIPSYIVIPTSIKISPEMVQLDYSDAAFTLPDKDPVVQKGKLWRFSMSFPEAMAELEPEKAWAQIRPSLLASGWTMIHDTPGQGRTARYQKNGHDSWLDIFVFGATDIRAVLIEVGPSPMKLTLQRPAIKPEIVDPLRGDFPYLAPLPGSKFNESLHEDGTLLIDVDVDKGTTEQELAGEGSILKRYSVPANLASPLMFTEAYRSAFTQAGWKVVHVSQGVNQGDAVINAHYTNDGRDIWATLHSSGSDYELRIADAGTGDLAKQLERDCHVALYGIHYDFNKATIRIDSTPTLEKILALLQSKPDLSLEVQGHTDNVGDDAYNQKLSDARAASVVSWMTGKGIAADRLSAHGYGMKVPVADNGTDEGRAKNRRVELKKQGCSN